MPPKHSLGKGLGAMFPDLLGQVQEKKTYILCGIEELFPNRFQPRKDFDDKSQQQLAASIRKGGIIQPIIVRKAEKGYEIIAGERRWRAAQTVGLKEVPVIIREAADAEVALLSLIENLLREDLNPIEEAGAYQTVIGQFDLSQEELAARVGKDRSTITNTVRLLRLPEKIRAALTRKVITAGHGRAILSLQTREEQTRAFQQIKKKSLSVRETEDLVQQMKAAGQRGAPPAKARRLGHRDPYVADMERTLSSHFLAPVQIIPGTKNGTIRIRYKNMEDLHRLLGLLLDAET